MLITAVGCTENQKYIFGLIGLDYLDISQLDLIEPDTTIVVYENEAVLQEVHISELKRRSLRLVYYFRHDNQQTLRNLINNGFYNIYKLREEITVEDILDTVETNRSLEQASAYLNKKIEVNTFTDVVITLDKFLQAIENCDEETIEEIYQGAFDKLLGFKGLMESTIVESDTLKLEQRELKTKFDQLMEKYNELTKRHDTLIIAGKETEKKNVELTNVLSQVNIELNKKEKSLLEDSDVIKDLSGKISQLESEKLELQTNLNNVTNQKESVKAQLDRTSKELDELSAQVSISRRNIEDINIQIIELGKIQTFIYIKAYDMVPDVLTYFDKYPKYAENKLSINGLSILVICPKSSSMYLNYKQTYPDILEEMKKAEVTKTMIPKGMYVVEGFTEKIADIIKNIDSQELIIIDLTLRGKLLTYGTRQKNLFIINSAESIKFNRLNPADCISYTDLSSEGVRARFPIIEGMPLPAALKLMRDTLYAVLDTYWRC